MLIDQKTALILLSKPERVSRFDDRLPEQVTAAVGGRRAALVEIAGRDSIAAGLRAAASGDYEVLIPTIVYTGTEFGDWETVIRNVRILSERAGDLHGVQVLEPAILGSPRLWNAAAGRFMGALYSRYGFSPVCVACHMYLHAARVPLALATGAEAIVSGERVRHGDRRKLNQHSTALDAYRDVVRSADLRLDMPIKEVRNGNAVENLVGFPWKESTRQMGCVFERNYLDVSGGIIGGGATLEAYLREFLVPFFTRVLAEFKNGVVEPRYGEIVSEVMSALE